MSDCHALVIRGPALSFAEAGTNGGDVPAFAYRAEPDPSEPVAAEPGVTLAQADGNDLDVVGHRQETTPMNR